MIYHCNAMERVHQIKGRPRSNITYKLNAFIVLQDGLHGTANDLMNIPHSQAGMKPRF